LQGKSGVCSSWMAPTKRDRGGETKTKDECRREKKKLFPEKVDKTLGKGRAEAKPRQNRQGEPKSSQRSAEGGKTAL